MRSLWKTLLSFDNLMITLATVFAGVMIYVVPQNFDFLNPLGAAVSDLDITDMVFSKFRSDDKVISDTSIVIVNIGDLDRAGIAMQIENIQRFNPAVIGVDAFFSSEKDPFGDSLLAAVIARTPNIVLATKLDHRESIAVDEVGGEAVTVGGAAEAEAEEESVNAAFDTLVTSLPMFHQNATGGYVNLITDGNEDAKTCREVTFSEECANKSEYSFPVELARKLSPNMTAAALQRTNATETVNFIGNHSQFFVLEADEALDAHADLSFVQGKVVILGYMGDRIGQSSVEDKFFTPLNEHYVGRSLPDMYGVVIHANVVSMILRADFIWAMVPWQKLCLALSLLVFNVLLFTYLYTHHENWYDLLAVVTQVVQSLALLVITIRLFDEYSIKVDPTSALLGVFLVGPVHDLYQDSLKKIIVNMIDRAQKSASKITSSRTSAANSTKDKT